MCVCVCMREGFSFYLPNTPDKSGLSVISFDPCPMLDKQTAAVQSFSILLLLIDYYYFLMLTMDFVYIAGCLSG